MLLAILAGCHATNSRLFARGEDDILPDCYADGSILGAASLLCEWKMLVWSGFSHGVREMELPGSWSSIGSCEILKIPKSRTYLATIAMHFRACRSSAQNCRVGRPTSRLERHDLEKAA